MPRGILLWADRRGVAALEFALMAPVLVLVLLFGTIEISRAVRATTMLNAASGAAAQMVGQMKTATGGSGGDLGDVCKAGAMLTNRFNADDAAVNPPLSMSIANVSAKGKTNPNDPVFVATLMWKSDTACGNTGVMSTDPVIAATPLLTRTGDSVVIVQANYVYKPLLTSFLSSALSTRLARTNYALALFNSIVCTGC